MRCVLFLLTLSLWGCFATSGVDMSTLVSVDKFECLLRNGFSFAIPRGFCSLGDLDSNVAQTVKNAHQAGVKNIDVYLYPCFKNCNTYHTPQDQVKALINHLHSQGADFYSTIWIDIECVKDDCAGTHDWSRSVESNSAFLKEMLGTCRSLLGASRCGIYTSPHYWKMIFENNADPTFEAKLWWPRYNGNSSCEQFEAFGPWKRHDLAMRQWMNTNTKCEASIDISVTC
eukprot:TRINITY_DN866_c0_g1_i1.p1 TRINITY_DN866_c0_g1~~TRINITY_DN866_c0_g1_i1.p1  ORF type:complete len:229 (-),score=6.79 TRINITY_DN866_c0_g1_i1:243-929(-)